MFTFVRDQESFSSYPTFLKNVFKNCTVYPKLGMRVLVISDAGTEEDPPSRGTNIHTHNTYVYNSAYLYAYLPTYHTCKASGLLIAVAPRYRYCSGTSFTVAVAVAVAPILLAESSGDSGAATFLVLFSAIRYRYFKKRKLFFSAAHFSESVFSPIHQLFTSLICLS